MPLRELRPVLREHHRQVGEARQRCTERLVEQDLDGCVDHVIAPARHDGDAHRDVVDDRAEVVERHPVGAHEHRILLGRVRRRHLAEDHVGVGHGARGRRIEANDEGQIRRRAHALLARAGVAKLRLGVFLLQGLALGVELFLGAVTAKGGLLLEELLDELLVDRQALHLAVGAVRAAHLGALVPAEPEPLHVAEDDRLVLGRAPFAISVFDAEDERAPRLSRPEPVEERRAHPADVEVARGGGSEAKTRPVDHRSPLPQAHCRQIVRAWVGVCYLGTSIERRPAPLDALVDPRPGHRQR